MKNTVLKSALIVLSAALFASCGGKNNFQGELYEAEKGQTYTANVTNNEKGCSGGGFVNFKVDDSSKVALEFDVDENGEYLFAVSVRCSSDESKRVSLKATCDNGKYLSAQKINYTKKFSEVLLNSSIKLEKGSHKIFITSTGGTWDLDYIKVIRATDELKSKIQPSSTLVTKNPSPQAQALYDYLLKMRGKGILSGQQVYTGTPEMKVIRQTTGSNPAIIGIDLIDCSSSRVSHGTKSAAVRTALNYAKEGGIVTCSWHWNAPVDLVDKDLPNQRWYDGFRTEATTFDFTKGLHSESSREYKVLIFDIDLIAVELKKLQDAGIPVLWRPLHEASGGWFWWGSKGSEAYIELYKMVFDRLQNYHGLNNLIWVWNGQNPDWYPGDEYCDVISYDSYPEKHQHSEVLVPLARIQSATALPKLCAISENGALPDVIKLAENGGVWSWFCTWDGEFVMKDRKYSEEYTSAADFKRFYASDFLVTREKLPNLYDAGE